MLESATRRKRKRSITVEPSCIFDTSPSPSQRAYNLRSSPRDDATPRSPSCPPIAYIDAVASEDAEGGNDTSIVNEDEDGLLIDELASPKESDPLTIEALLQRSSAARTKTYRGRHKRRRVHFAESDHDYAPLENDAGEAEDLLGPAANDQPGDDDNEPLALLASSPLGSSVAAPPRKKKKKSLSHRLTIAALECGGTVPVELPTTPPRIPLTFVAANGTTKPPKRPRKTGHLVDPRRRAGFGRSISHFRAAAAQRAAAAAASPSRPALASSSTAVAKSRYRAKWRTHAPPMLPKAYFPSCAADTIIPPPGKKPHRRQVAQVSDIMPLKFVPLEESVVGAKAKAATGRTCRRMARKKDAVLTGPGPLTFVSVLTRNARSAYSSLPDTGCASSPGPTFCMTSVRDRLLGSRQPPIDANTNNGIEGSQALSSTAISDPVDAENSLYAGSASQLSANASSKQASTSISKNALSSTSKCTLSSSSRPAPFFAFKTPVSINTKTPLRINANTILHTNANKTIPSSTKPLKPLATFHDRLAETVRTASQLVDAATGVLRTPEGSSRRRKRASEVSGRKAARVSLADRRDESSTRNSGDPSSTRPRMSSVRHSKVRSYQPPITSMLASSARPPDVSGARPSIALLPRPVEIRSPQVTPPRSSPVSPRSRSPRSWRASLIGSPLAHSPTNSPSRSPHSSRPRPAHTSRQIENRVCIDLCSSSPLLAAATRSALSSLPALSSSPALPIDMGPPPAQATTSYAPLPTTASRMSLSRFRSSQAIDSSPDVTAGSIHRDAAPATQIRAPPATRKQPPQAQPASGPSSDSIQSSSPSFVMHSVRRLQSRTATAREGLEVVWR